MMTQTELVATSSFTAENSLEVELNYFVKTYSTDAATVYGIYLEAMCQHLLESSMDSSPISEDRDYVVDLAIKMAQGHVPPCCLCEVLDEIAV